MRKLDLIYLGESNPDDEQHNQDATQRERSVDLRVGSSAATNTRAPGDIPVGELTPV
jgi:hypothetical protein